MMSWRVADWRLWKLVKQDVYSYPMMPSLSFYSVMWRYPPPLFFPALRHLFPRVVFRRVNLKIDRKRKRAQKIITILGCYVWPGAKYKLRHLLNLTFVAVSCRQLLANVHSRSRSLCRRPSVCRLSVCNVRASYSGEWNFRQYFYAICYVGHLLTFRKKLWRSSQGNPFIVGVKYQRGKGI